MPIKITHQSNKTQPLGKKGTEGGTKKSSEPSFQSEIKPFIDKISIVIDPSTEEDAYEIHSNIFAQFEDKVVFQSAGPKALKGWKRAYLIAVNCTQYRPLLQYHWQGSEDGPNKTSRIRLDFNPRKLGEQGLSELHAVLTSLMDGGWNYVIEHGHITRIDIAVDAINIRMDEFLFIPKQGATEIQWARDGYLQSFRHGKPKGNQTIVYSVKHKRLSKGQKWSGPSTVRIERRLRNPSCAKLSDLPGLKNPFAEMAMTVMPGPPPDEAQKGKEWMWSLFEDSVRARGVRQALALIPEDRRTKYRSYLKQFPKPWWNPEAIWKNWPAACQTLLKG